MEKVLRSTGYRVENLEDLRQIAPAAFSGEHNRSHVYSFVSTTQILENLSKLGWNITYAKQQGSSKFSRHIIRLTNPELGYVPLKNERIRPQLILDNSHNGGSCAQLHPGLFRMVCESEMVIGAPDLFNDVKFRHMGLDFEELKEILGKMADQYKIVSGRISEMQEIILSKEQQLQFAMKALALKDPVRYVNDDGTINTKRMNECINPKVLLTPIRGEEMKSLWDTFQVVREWLIKGGFEQKSLKGRISRSRAINNAVRQISLNKSLWILAEEYLNKPEEVDVFEKLINAANTGNSSVVKTYVTSKGESKTVQVVSKLENGRTQVKDLKTNATFSVASDKLS